MRTSTLVIGSLLALAPKTIEAEDGYGAPPNTDTPVLYDIGTPEEAYRAMEADANLQFAYAEQVLKALGNGARKGPNLQIPDSGTFTVKVVLDGRGGLIASGHTRMNPDSPYVYADNIAWTMPACGEDGRSHLTHSFRKEEVEEAVSQSVWTGWAPEETKSTIELGGDRLTTVDTVDRARTAHYDAIAKRVACELEATLHP